MMTFWVDISVKSMGWLITRLDVILAGPNLNYNDKANRLFMFRF